MAPSIPRRGQEVAMDISHTRHDQVDTITISGRLDAATAPALRAKLDSLFEAGRDRIVLDLEQLNYVSSPGLRVLIEARKRARERKLSDLQGGDVRIVHLPARIREVFELTGFISLFEIYDDLAAAVGSF
jgi:anti-sigma B factor antagonist